MYCRQHARIPVNNRAQVLVLFVCVVFPWLWPLVGLWLYYKVQVGHANIQRHTYKATQAEDIQYGYTCMTIHGTMSARDWEGTELPRGAIVGPQESG